MIGPVLISRVYTLKEKLNRIKDWLGKVLPDLETEGGETSNGSGKHSYLAGRMPNAIMRDALLSQLRNPILYAANRQIKDLDGIVDSVVKAQPDEREAKLQEAWHKYAQAYEESQEVFREYLELIGGMAIRNEGLDQQICSIADDLISNCSTNAGATWNSLTVPAAQEALTRVVASIIRLRFPEWTIWSLPLTAHEFGHWISQEIGPQTGLLTRFVDEHHANWPEYHLEDYLADAFATYTMGPTYACAAISLRFNPSDAYTDKDRQPCDGKRVYIILGMLKQMNEAEVRNPYNDILEHLNTRWDNMLKGAKTPHSITDEQRGTLDDLIGSLYKEFNNEMYLVKHPCSGRDEGWLVAQDWSDQWLEELRANAPGALSVPEARTSYKVRDALTAAWVCRTYYESDENQQVDSASLANTVFGIGEAAQELCKKIIEKRSGASGNSKGGTASQGR